MLPKLLDPRPSLADLADPRRETRNKLHPLRDILMIVLCAVCCAQRCGGLGGYGSVCGRKRKVAAWLSGPA